MYTHIYIYRERDIHIYIYTHIHIHTHLYISGGRLLALRREVEAVDAVDGLADGLAASLFMFDFMCLVFSLFGY